MDPVRIGGLAEAFTTTRRPDASGNPSVSFSERMAAAVRDANRLQLEAEEKTREMVVGKADIVETVMALSKADLSLRLVTNLRNRLLEAYHEIMRLQV